MTRPLVLVKLGGSLITDKAGHRSVRREILHALAREIAAALERDHRLVVAHGSGSFGHPEAAAARLAEGLTDEDQLVGVPRTQEAARALHREVLNAFTGVGVPTYSLLPGSLLVTESGVPASLFVEPVLLALGVKLLPVLCGDLVLDRDRGVSICSTETLFLALASQLLSAGEAVERVIWLGATPGVYDRQGNTLPSLDRASWNELELRSPAAAGPDVTGGIELRVETALALADLGIPSVICDGTDAPNLRAALAGERAGGTLVPERAP
jgi:isopentenyl phosphate kinase